MKRINLISIISFIFILTFSCIFCAKNIDQKEWGYMINSFETVNHELWGFFMTEMDKDLSKLKIDDYLKIINKRKTKRRYLIIQTHLDITDKRGIKAETIDFYLYLYLKKYKKTLVDQASTSGIDGIFKGYIEFDDAIKKVKIINKG